MLLLLSCIAVALAAPSADHSNSFTDYRLIEVTPTNIQQHGILSNLSAIGLDSEFYDFWSFQPLGGKADIMVSPDQYGKLTSYLHNNGMATNIIVNNMQQLVEKSLERAAVPQLMFNNIVDHSKYHNLAQIESYVDDLVSRYPGNAQKLSLSLRTHEGRQMNYLKITGGSPKKAIIIESTIHAREWISPAATLYFVDRLLARADAEATFMIDNFDWYVLYVANPDGYAYTHSNSRMWRKNRSPTGCVGVDLNRNFDYFWGYSGTSSNCASDIFLGPSAMSELESQNINQLVDIAKGSPAGAICFLAIHSYSQMILTPYAHRMNARPPNSVNLDNYARSAADALKAIHGKTFAVGPAPNLLYASAGGSDDWAIGTKGVKYAYTYELRPTGNPGFLLPANQIVPSGEEFYASLHSLAVSFSTD